MNYFIDTNIFLRVLTKDNPQQFKHCVRFLKLVKQGKIKAFTSTVVMAEIAWTLLSFYEFPKNKVVKALRATLNLKNLKIVDRFQPRQAVNLYQQHQAKFIDSLIASLPQVADGKMTVVSFDHDFDDLKIKREEPQAVLEAQVDSAES